jgi:hypothetical protein
MQDEVKHDYISHEDVPTSNSVHVTVTEEMEIPTL